MEKWLDDMLPLFGVEHDCIVSKQGDITVAYRVELPEVFTMSAEDFETVHFAWVKAIKALPKFTVLHKQDWFLENHYRPPKGQMFESFLGRASGEYFMGRPFLDHSCYLFLTKMPAGRKGSSSLVSSLIRHTIVPQQVLQAAALSEFEDKCGQFRQILESTKLITLRRLRSDELLSDRRSMGVIERYYNLAQRPDAFIMQDLTLGDGLKVGSRHVQLYTLGDVLDLPHLCGSRITYDKYSTDVSKFSIGFASSVGLLLPFNHIYNQYIFIGDGQAKLQELEKKRLRLQSLSVYSRENSIAWEATNDFLNEAIAEQRLPVKAHFNVTIWSEDRLLLKDMRNRLSAALAQMDASAKEETVGGPQIFWAGIPGNAADFPGNDSFDTFCEQACCFLNLESNYRSDPPQEGIRFCDRISGRPVFLDMFTAPRKRGTTNNMGMLVCGASGGGKSMTVNAILRGLYDQGAHCVIIDIGGSYKAQCELHKGYYFTYTEENPIKFNPFYLPPGVPLDTEKKESLKSLLLALWKQEDERFYRSEYVALSNALQGYYNKLATDSSIFPCFNTFYEYLQNEYAQELHAQHVRESDFNIGNFLYVLRPYYEGHEFDYLLNARENLDLLHERFIVIELDAIKDHPTLFPCVTLIVIELFLSKMRKLSGIRKVLIIDEAWKAIAKTGMAEFLKYAFKTVRKFEGIPCVVTQELDDLVSSPIIKDAIINNADIKILMDMRKYVNKFDKLQDTLGLSDKAKTILLSVNKDDREIFIDLGGNESRVYRNELCPHEYYAFTTDGKERVEVLEYAEKYGSMEAGIHVLVQEKRRA
jgi:conjugation system TraG family ATPase